MTLSEAEAWARTERTEAALRARNPGWTNAGMEALRRAETEKRWATVMEEF